MPNINPLTKMINVHCKYQAEDDAKAKDKELSEALERMRQYEAVSPSYIVKSVYYFMWYNFTKKCFGNIV